MRRIRFTIRSLMVLVAALAVVLPLVPPVTSWLFPPKNSPGVINCSSCPISPEYEAALAREIVARQLKEGQAPDPRLIRQAEALEEAVSKRTRAIRLLQSKSDRANKETAARLIQEAEALEDEVGVLSRYYPKFPVLPLDEAEILLEPSGP